jgi:hypothetical protein
MAARTSPDLDVSRSSARRSRRGAPRLAKRSPGGQLHDDGRDPGFSGQPDDRAGALDLSVALRLPQESRLEVPGPDDEPQEAQSVQLDLPACGQELVHIARCLTLFSRHVARE